MSWVGRTQKRYSTASLEEYYAKWKEAPLTERQKSIIEKRSTTQKENSIIYIRYIRDSKTGSIIKLKKSIPYFHEAQRDRLEKGDDKESGTKPYLNERNTGF
jgi:hypothetical protein